VPVVERSPPRAKSAPLKIPLLLENFDRAYGRVVNNGREVDLDIALGRGFNVWEVLPIAGELPVESCGIIDQNLLAQGLIRSPRRQQVKEMTVVDAKQWRNIARRAVSSGVRDAASPSPTESG
jgi:hypothetical protein